MNETQSAGFFARRWRGQVPLAALFWRDMIGVGSLINLAASLSALIAMASGLPQGLAIAIHFAPLPYNLFLFAAVWRNSRGLSLLGLGALIWLILASLV